MQNRQRKQLAARLLRSLESLEEEWRQESEQHPSPNSPSAVARRERLKAIEAQTALIRLMQSESRLRQQILLGLGSFATGSLVTWLAQRFLGK